MSDEPKEKPDVTETTDDSEKTVIEQEAPKPQLAPELVERAKGIGFTDDDIEALGEGLPAALAAADRTMAAMYKTAEADKQQQAGHPAFYQAQQYAQQPTQQAQAQQGPPFDVMKELGAKLGGLDEVDEAVVKAINDMNEHYANMMYRVASGMGELVSRTDNANQTLDRFRFDRQLEGLGEDWRDVTASPRERDRLHEQVKTLQAMHRQRTGRELHADEALQQALGSLYYKRVAELERKRLDGKIGQRLNQASMKPTSRETEPPQGGMDAALQRIRKAKSEELAVG